MTSENFAYWLKGYFEISNSNQLTEEQVKMIKQHLDYVFNKPLNVSDTLTSTVAAGHTTLLNPPFASIC